MCDTPSISAMSLMLSFSTIRRFRISPSRESIFRGRPFFPLLSALMDVPKGGPKTGPHAIGLNSLAGLRYSARRADSDFSYISFHVFPPPLGWLPYTLLNLYLNLCNKFPKGKRKKKARFPRACPIRRQGSRASLVLSESSCGPGPDSVTPMTLLMVSTSSPSGPRPLVPNEAFASLGPSPLRSSI